MVIFDKRSYTKVSEKFENVAFCNPFPATYAEYPSVRLDTTKNGDFAASSSYGKSGDCAGLLAFDASALIGRKK